MKLALVRDGIVENVIVPPEGEWAAPDGVILVECEDEEPVGPGHLYDGSSFAAPAPPVPASVAPTQMRKALAEMGLYDLIEDYVAQSPMSVQIEWRFANSIERSNATLATAQVALGMSDADVDDLFRLAATL